MFELSKDLDYDILQDEILKKLDLLASKMFSETATRPEIANHRVYDYKCLKFRLIFGDEYINDSQEARSEE